MAYVASNRYRQNLTVRMDSQIRRLIVESGQATGDELLNGTFLTAKAEVILASGAIESPRLLQVSGISPADHLKPHWIKVVHDQPQIGANLQDRLDICCIAELSGPYSHDRYAKHYWAATTGLQ